MTAYEAYIEEIGRVTPAIRNELDRTVRLYGEETVVRAINEAAFREVRNWSYVRGVLNNWQREAEGDRSRDRDHGAYGKVIRN